MGCTVGWSGCGLSINMKKVGEEMNAVKNSGYFPACNAVVMLKIKARPGALVRTKGFGPGNEKEPKKVTFKLEQGV